MVDKNSKTRTMRRKEYIQSFYCYPLVKKTLFNGLVLVKCAKYAYIRVQRVKINKNRHFVFRFTSLPVLTVFNGFSTVILDRKLMT